MKYLRKKGRWANGESKFVIEEGGKFIKTVPKVTELLRLIRQDSINPKQSQNKPQTEQNNNQKFSHEILSEQTPDVKNKTVED